MNDDFSLLFHFRYLHYNLSHEYIIITLGSANSTLVSTTTSTDRQGSERRKTVTFDDGVKPGVETTTSAATATTNIMSSFKTRANDTDTDQISLFRPGSI